MKPTGQMRSMTVGFFAGQNLPDGYKKQKQQGHSLARCRVKCHLCLTHDLNGKRPIACIR